MGATSAPPATSLQQRSFRALGTTVAVMTTAPRSIDAAAGMLSAQLDALDRACSRFRANSEVERLRAANGRAVRISALLGEVVAAAISAARLTDGAVDPTVGAAMIALGYDRDFANVHDGPSLAGACSPAPGWASIELDQRSSTLRLPPGAVLDLGSAAKAWAADRAAANITEALGGGVLVNLGGDISVAGTPPVDGWSVGIAADCRVDPASAVVVVAITSGGLASSGTVVRSWRRGDQTVHHIVDPATGDSAMTRWRLVSVAADSCATANALSTGAIVWGADAVAQLEARGAPARLIRDDGVVVTTGGWPDDPSAVRSV